MELRHLRYFVAVSDQRSFLQAARHLRVAQPALSRQIRDLESELGVTLFKRIPRGVVLTSAGEAFLAEARSALAAAAKAVAAAQRVQEEQTSVLRFAHGSEMGVFAPLLADLVTAFRSRHWHVELRVTNTKQSELLAWVRSHDTDVAATFLMQWPAPEFESHRLLNCALTGVLLGATHPLAAKSSLRLSELREFTFLSRSKEEWPENYHQFLAALRERGLVPRQRGNRSGAAPSGSVELAVGNAWSLANEAIAAPFLMTTKSIVFRPFVEPPIPVWLALIWLPGAPERVQQLVAVARTLCPEAALAGRSLGLKQARNSMAATVVDGHHGDGIVTSVA